MNVSREVKRYSARFLDERRSRFQVIFEKADSALKSCTEQEGALLRFLLATMPLSDLTDSVELMRSTVQGALRAREQFSWCAELPENLFLLYVLPPRVNNESLSDCRELFREELADRVKSLSLHEAILEVNRWCAEHVTYRSTDDRTASALAIYNCGYGRCGEESTFAVNALRSVGIAARQVYAPWWSHCDDNHAWVEVWDGKGWRFLGACEPEPELDRGWFPGAAARSMMVHARCFLSGSREDWGFLFPESGPADLFAEDGVVCETVTDRYAKIRPVTVAVMDEEGKPLPDVRVSFSVLNMASFREIAARKTGQTGTAAIRLGLGSVQISAGKDDLYGEILVNTTGIDGVTLILRPVEGLADGETEFDLTVPAGAKSHPEPLSGEQRALRRAWLDHAAELHDQWVSRDRTGRPLTDEEARIAGTLTKKDRWNEIGQSVLSDSISALQWEDDLPADVFEKALLSPRVWLEPLAPWRQRFAALFSAEEQAAFRRQPELLWHWVEEHIETLPMYGALPGALRSTLTLSGGTEQDRKTLFCGLCRAIGVPARLSPADGTPEYYVNQAYHRVGGGASEVLRLHLPEGHDLLLNQTLSVSRLKNGRFLPLDQLEERVEPGLYRIITVTRLPSGGQLGCRWDLTLGEGEEKTVDLRYRQARVGDLLTSLPLPAYTLYGLDSQPADGLALAAEAPASLLAWLELGREPTEHLLGELREFAPGLKDCPIRLVLEAAEDREDPTLKKALSALQNVGLWLGDFTDTAAALARAAFADPDKLPLVLLIDRQGKLLYSISGYNVGTAELLVNLLREVEKK